MRICIAQSVLRSRKGEFHLFRCSKTSSYLNTVYSHYFCGVCLILIKRPPNRDQLMELKSKDLQQYLNKNKISTHGLVGKMFTANYISKV